MVNAGIQVEGPIWQATLGARRPNRKLGLDEEMVWRGRGGLEVEALHGTDAAVGPVPRYPRFIGQAVGLAVEEDQPARRPPARSRIGAVLRIGIIDVQAEVIARLLIAIGDRIPPLGRALVPLEAFVALRRIAILQARIGADRPPALIDPQLALGLVDQDEIRPFPSPGLLRLQRRGAQCTGRCEKGEECALGCLWE